MSNHDKVKEWADEHLSNVQEYHSIVFEDGDKLTIGDEVQGTDFFSALVESTLLNLGIGDLVLIMHDHKVKALWGGLHKEDQKLMIAVDLECSECRLGYTTVVFNLKETVNKKEYLNSISMLPEVD